MVQIVTVASDPPNTIKVLEGAVAEPPVSSKADLLDTYNNQTGTSYTLQAADLGKIVALNNAAAITVTIPNSLPAGFNCLLSQVNMGQVTVVAGAGATLNAYPSGGVKTPGRHTKVDISVRTNIGGTSAVADMSGGST